MVAEKDSFDNHETDLIARAISIARIRVAHPGPSIVCLDLLLEILATELWRNPMKLQQRRVIAAFSEYSAFLDREAAL
jgi:hypothetical protein